MILTNYVNTLGFSLRQQYGERVHKVAIDAAMTCPNRDGSKGIGGCTFCNNSSFSPNGRQPLEIKRQIENGRQVIRKRTGAMKYLAYFQAYTNTYADVEELKVLYDMALAEADVVGLSVGTRPDCVPDRVLDLLAAYQDRGYTVWLELGLQSSFDETLERVNRGHGFAEYLDAVKRAHQRHLPVCTHLITGLPGEEYRHALLSHERVLQSGVQGLKYHPLHVVKGTRLANQWRRGEYQPLQEAEYIDTICDLVELTPAEVIFHRLTGTASEKILLAPAWCSKKWQVLNGIAAELKKRGSYQGKSTGEKQRCLI